MSAGRPDDLRRFVQQSGRAVHGRVRRHVPAWPGASRRRGRDVVLLWHRVAARAQPDPLGMTVHPEVFRRQLDAVRDEYEVVPAQELLGRPAGRRPRAALTFDDGYADNAELVAPLLVSLGLPATFFLTTDPLRESWAPAPPEYWWDALDHLLADLSGQTVVVHVGSRRHLLQLTTDVGRAAAAKTLNRQLVRQRPGVVEACLDDLRSAGAQDRTCDEHRRMSVEQAVALAALPGLEIGSHTCSHAPLGRLPASEGYAELVRSRDALGDVLGRPPQAVAYPYGAAGTLRRRDARAAARAGYTTGYVNVPGPVEGAPPHVVPRVTVAEEPPEALLRRLRSWDAGSAQ